jgi:lipopolysaccharide transport system permease protein
MVAVIEGFRWAIIGRGAYSMGPGFWLSMLIVGLLLCSGVRRFRRLELQLADVI